MPLFPSNKVAPAPSADGYFSEVQFPIGDDAATVIQDQTKWTTPMLKIEKAAAEKRPSLIGESATDEDKAYASRSGRIIELINAELKRRGVEGGRRRKTRGRKTRRRRHRRRTSRR